MPVQFVPIEHVEHNPFQPRTTIDPDGISDLAANILASQAVAPDTFGLLQVPRGRPWYGRVQLAYGHRRLAAFQQLAKQGHSEYCQFPVDLTELTDADMAVAAWSENAARADINPMEEVHFIRRIMDEFGWTGKEVARKLGVPYGTLSNIVRLAKLPAEIQDLIASGQISKARAVDLCGLQDKMSDDALIRLAQGGKTQSYRGWSKHLDHARRATETGVDLLTTVIEPAATSLASSLQADDPGAWFVVARAIDSKAEDIESSVALARLVIERAVLRSLSVYEGRKRINALFMDAGLETPWNAQATAKVTEFVAWRKKHQKSARA